MIPNFPDFKPIGLSDREEIENFTKFLPPYSDFNFVSMFSWDTKNDMGLSKINGNLVVKFTDYLTGDPFLSFFGTNEIQATIETLLNFDQIKNGNSGLKLIPKEIADVANIPLGKFNIYQDPDHDDYIYSIEDLLKYEGNDLKKQRNLLSSFKRRHGEAYSKIINLTDPNIYIDIMKLYKTWENNKNVSIPHEFTALKKCLSEAANLPIFGIGIFMGDSLIAFSVNQIESDNYASCFFAKGNIEYYGIYSFLMNEAAKIFSKKSVKYLNYEQDLGLFNLRKSKNSFAPVSFLRKFCISKKDEYNL